MDLQFWFDTQTKLFPQAVILDLIHVRPVGSRRVHRYVLPEKDPSSVISQAITKAHGDARTFSKGQQIYVLALLEPDGDAAVSEYRWNVGEQDVGAAYDAEQATSEGLLKQLMRFNSNLHREARAAFKEVQAALIQEHARIAERCSYLEDRHQQVMNLQEDLLSQRHDRDLSSHRAMRAEQRKDKALAEVAVLLPTMAKKFLHADAAPTAATADANGNDEQSATSGGAAADPIVSALGRSLSQEQVQKLMGILTPAQQAAAYEVFFKDRAKAADDPSTPTPSN